jgi:hypothetical protein
MRALAEGEMDESILVLRVVELSSDLAAKGTIHIIINLRLK